VIDEGRLLFEEPMTGLTGRFRQVHVTLAREAALPATIPDGWVEVRAAGNVLTFVDTRFSEEGFGERVRSLVDEVRTIDAQSMALRTIFTTMARAARDGDL
jgi:hypothetical protein